MPITRIMKYSLGCLVALLFVFLTSPAQAAKPGKPVKVSKERLVLMPLRVAEEDKSLQGAMETALVEGLQQKYEVFSGEQVSQKAREIFMKESRNTAKKECDETRCMQGIAEAFQAELIATANVTKQGGGYFLALSIQNIFDNKVEHSKTLTCKGCDSFQVVDKLKELVGASAPAVSVPAPEAPQTTVNPNDPDGALWTEAQKGNTVEDYQVYLDSFPKGKYLPLAKARIKKIKEADRKVVDEIFESAKKGDSTRLGEIEGLARQGNADAQGNLARMYLNGWGVKKDYAEAWKWAQKAAAQGNSDGQNVLGVALNNGFGVAKDGMEAVKWFRKAAALGNANAQNNLGLAYFKGQGVAKDEAESVKWFRKAAEQGNANAQAQLGMMYSNGKGVAKDEAEAVRWFRKSAEQGNADAQVNLGVAYIRGQGVAEDEMKAAEWFREAAAQGNAVAQFNLGIVAKDEAEAVKWFRKAAEQGNADAQTNLGIAYFKGEGVAKDEAEAVKWFRKATEQGNAEAKRFLERL